MTPPKDTQRVCLGVIVGVKGLRGELRVKSFTEEPGDVAAYGPLTAGDGRIFNLSVVNVQGDVVIATVEGITDRNGAEALKGLELFVDRAVLPETEGDTYYHADLIGLAVETTEGERVGKVSAFYNFGGGDVMEVTAEGRSDTGFVPFTADVIAAVDVAGGKVVIVPTPGLFEDEKAEDLKAQEAQEESK
ncbi:MAG: ribosome maturation factor RimM [Rhodospirillaceae bacterium]